MVSVNTAIKALIEFRIANNNFSKYPFTSSVLLFTLITHDKQSINLDRLVDWAFSYLTEKVEKKGFNKSLDSEITALFLVYYCLKKTKIRSIPKTTEDYLVSLYNKHYSDKKLFFDDFIYTSVIQFSASFLEKRIAGYSDNARNIVSKYLNQEHFNSSLASIFLMLLNRDRMLYQKIKLHINNVTKYEDKTNYMYAIWIYEKNDINEADFKSLQSAVVTTEPPLLADLYNDGDITNYHPSKLEHATAKLSPLYLSTLYSLYSEIDNQSFAVNERHIDRKYKTGIFNRLAGLLFGLASLILAMYLIKYAADVYFQSRVFVNVGSIILFLLGTLFVYPIGYTLLADLMIYAKPDVRIIEIMKARTIEHWLKKFVSFVVITVFIGILINLVSDKLTGWSIF